MLQLSCPVDSPWEVVEEIIILSVLPLTHWPSASLCLSAEDSWSALLPFSQFPFVSANTCASVCPLILFGFHCSILSPPPFPNLFFNKLHAFRLYGPSSPGTSPHCSEIFAMRLAGQVIQSHSQDPPSPQREFYCNRGYSASHATTLSLGSNDTVQVLQGSFCGGSNPPWLGSLCNAPCNCNKVSFSFYSHLVIILEQH